MFSWITSYGGVVSAWVFGLLGFVLTVYQTINVVKKNKEKKDVERINEQLIKANEEIRKANRRKYEDRYGTLFSSVESLIKELDIACGVVNKECVKNTEPCGIISTKVNSAMKLTERIADTCFIMNNDHRDLYGQRIVVDLENKLTRNPCVKATE